MSVSNVFMVGTLIVNLLFGSNGWVCSANIHFIVDQAFTLTLIGLYSAVLDVGVTFREGFIQVKVGSGTASTKGRFCTVCRTLLCCESK